MYVHGGTYMQLGSTPGYYTPWVIVKTSKDIKSQQYQSVTHGRKHIQLPENTEHERRYAKHQMQSKYQRSKSHSMSNEPKQWKSQPTISDFP